MSSLRPLGASNNNLYTPPSLGRPLSSSTTTTRPLSDADARLRSSSNHPHPHPHPVSNYAQPNYNLSTAGAGGISRAGSKGKSAWYGREREYYGEPVISRLERLLLVGVVGVALVVRLWKIWAPASVVFDEVHFGGFASKYIRQVFFMDVHPPLAKLLITLAAKVGGFNGNFDFKDIGKEYLEADTHVPYVTMRLLTSLLGVAVVPISYLTMRSLGSHRTTSLLASTLITFENGLVTQSRLILLDSPLVFFTALTAFVWVRFSNEDYAGVPFGRRWWTYLTLTGLSLGAVVSCKWVGLFTIATIGLCVLRQLWLLLGNLKVTPRMWLRHFAARALCLIVLPSLFYMFMFQIHFWILNRSGDGDGFMSSEFQHTLKGHGMEDTYADVGFGSKVSIRHVNTQGGYLHSHAHAYPGGSQQQQITLYPHRDDNNVWRITNASTDSGPADTDWDTLPLTHIDNGMKIRLQHVITEKRLHSHDVRPPVSEVDFQNEVSGYGFPGFAGDANDDFIVELSPHTRGGKDRSKARKRLRTLRSHFRLRHAMTGCYLFSHKVKLPEWGFEQQEVTCNKNPTWDNSLWYVETNTHAQLGLGDELVNYQKPGFMSKFLELQAVMWQTNAGLTERHAYDSRPNHWPWLRRGINFWVKNHTQIYLIGNPIIWWSSTAAVVAYLAVRGLLVLRAQRGYKDLRHPTVQTYDEICGFLVTAWALHYLPFYLMQRQLFLHHYLPALYFAILCFCSIFDLFTKNLKPSRRVQIAVVFILMVLYAFRHFSPLAYGEPWTKRQCESSKYLKTWDFSCADFYEHKSDYYPGKIASPSVGPVESTAVAQPVEPLPNVFEDINKQEAPEEKTSGIVDNPPRLKDMYEASSLERPEGAEVTEREGDMRAPLGKDAGAAEATGSNADAAGWRGGAEDEEGVEAKVVEQTPVAQQPKQVVVEAPPPEMDLDEEARRLVQQAMENDEV